MPLLRTLGLPVRAPMLMVLFFVAVVLGNHWNVLRADFTAAKGLDPVWFWFFELIQVQVVVLLCTMPDLLLRQVSLVMASSRVMTLVVTLLLVVTGGIYLLKLNVLTNVLILGSAVLLARLDLTRIGVVPAPFPSLVLLSAVVYGGIAAGSALPHPTAHWFAA